MDCSIGEKGSDELIDEILGPEDLFNNEADENEDSDEEDEEDKDHKETTEYSEKHEEDSKEKVDKKVKKPRVVKNPRVILNFDTLTGNSGLSALKKLFTNFKFKGNGHEKEDLTKIMAILQQWMCYQLCPSYNFESSMLQLEALGKKKVVQTLMKKYRLGMDEWGENNDAENDLVGDKMEISEAIQRNEFDILLDEEIANAKSDDELSEPEVIQTQNCMQEIVKSNQEVVLTSEQLERIARNRKLAEERRQQRISGQCQPVEVSQQQEKTPDQEKCPENINSEDNS